jgi:hypothetical protein
MKLIRFACGTSESPEFGVVVNDHAVPFSTLPRGTFPDFTGLDHDDFLDPGAEVESTFERPGALRCRLAEPARTLLPSRWPVRSSVRKFHGGS